MNGNTDDNFVIFMYGRVRKRQFREWRQMAYRAARYQYLKARNWPKTCDLCRERVTVAKYRADTRTIDHIIPRNILDEYNLPQLEFDHRNFRIACYKCNMSRGLVTIDDIEEPLRSKIISAGRR